MKKKLFLFLLAALAAGAVAAPRPLYEELQEGSVQVRFLPEDRALARGALRILLETVEVHRSAGVQGLPEEVRLFVCPSVEECDRLAPGDTALPRWASAVAYPLSDTILLKRPGVEGASSDMRRTLIHEYSHLLFLRRLGHGGRASGPRWLDEGLAMLRSGHFGVDDHLRLARAALTGGWIPLAELESGWPADAARAELAYLESVSAVQHFLAEHGQASLELLVRRLEAGAPLDEAMRAAIGMSAEEFEQAWYERYRARELWLPLLVGGMGLWSAASVLLLLAYARKVRRARRTLVRWEAEEDEEEVKRQKAKGKRQKYGAAELVGALEAAPAAATASDEEAEEAGGAGPAPQGCEVRRTPGREDA